jgi:hypothetical protein
VKQAVATPFFKDFVAGDPEAAIAAAPVRFERTNLTAPQHQNPIELPSTVAIGFINQRVKRKPRVTRRLMRILECLGSWDGGCIVLQGGGPFEGVTLFRT